MQYTIDAERGILFWVEDKEADAVADLIDRRRLVAVEPETQPISLTDAVATCQRISAEIEAMDAQIRKFDFIDLDALPAPLGYCECDRIGVRRCGMCE